MPFRLSEQERALVLAWRAFTAYGNERDEAHKLLEDPADADGEDVWVEVARDGSGTVKVDPADPNAPTFAAVTWWELGDAAGKIGAASGVIAARRAKFHEAAKQRRRAKR